MAKIDKVMREKQETLLDLLETLRRATELIEGYIFRTNYDLCPDDALPINKILSDLFKDTSGITKEKLKIANKGLKAIERKFKTKEII